MQIDQPKNILTRFVQTLVSEKFIQKYYYSSICDGFVHTSYFWNNND